MLQKAVDIIRTTNHVVNFRAANNLTPFGTNKRHRFPVRTERHKEREKIRPVKHGKLFHFLLPDVIKSPEVYLISHENPITFTFNKNGLEVTNTVTLSYLF
eukprot:Lithocolla_globosa_v1_NODE_5648_length_1206_cov_3.185056.p2 type:complete len:101 gc:universal NODE_5648_length_1206_cov_3.185056:518-216(-)